MCPHLTVISKHVAECAVLKELGLPKIPGPSRSGHPCDTCQAQWKDGKPPTTEEITMPMAKILSYGKKMPLPTIVEQVQTLGAEGMQWATAGFPTTTEEEYQARLEICKTCPQYDAEQKRCSACGCFVEKAARMATKDCPDKKWPELERMKRKMAQGGCSSCQKS